MNDKFNQIIHALDARKDLSPEQKNQLAAKAYQEFVGTPGGPAAPVIRSTAAPKAGAGLTPNPSNPPSSLGSWSRMGEDIAAPILAGGAGFAIGGPLAGLSALTATSAARRYKATEEANAQLPPEKQSSPMGQAAIDAATNISMAGIPAASVALVTRFGLQGAKALAARIGLGGAITTGINAISARVSRGEWPSMLESAIVGTMGAGGEAFGAGMESIANASKVRPETQAFQASNPRLKDLSPKLLETPEAITIPDAQHALAGPIIAREAQAQMDALGGTISDLGIPTQQQIITAPTPPRLPIEAGQRVVAGLSDPVPAYMPVPGDMTPDDIYQRLVQSRLDAVPMPERVPTPRPPMEPTLPTPPGVPDVPPMPPRLEYPPAQPVPDVPLPPAAGDYPPPPRMGQLPEVPAEPGRIPTPDFVEPDLGQLPVTSTRPGTSMLQEASRHAPAIEAAARKRQEAATTAYGNLVKEAKKFGPEFTTVRDPIEEAVKAAQKIRGQETLPLGASQGKQAIAQTADAAGIMEADALMALVAEGGERNSLTVPQLVRMLEDLTAYRQSAGTPKGRRVGLELINGVWKALEQTPGVPAEFVQKARATRQFYHDTQRGNDLLFDTARKLTQGKSNIGARRLLDTPPPLETGHQQVLREVGVPVDKLRSDWQTRQALDRMRDLDSTIAEAQRALKSGELTPTAQKEWEGVLARAEAKKNAVSAHAATVREIEAQNEQIMSAHGREVADAKARTQQVTDEFYAAKAENDRMRQVIDADYERRAKEAGANIEDLRRQRAEQIAEVDRLQAAIDDNWRFQMAEAESETRRRTQAHSEQIKVLKDEHAAKMKQHEALVQENEAAYQAAMKSTGEVIKSTEEEIGGHMNILLGRTKPTGEVGEAARFARALDWLEQQPEDVRKGIEAHAFNEVVDAATRNPATGKTRAESVPGIPGSSRGVTDWQILLKGIRNSPAIANKPHLVDGLQAMAQGIAINEPEVKAITDLLKKVYSPSTPSQYADIFKGILKEASPDSVKRMREAFYASGDKDAWKSFSDGVFAAAFTEGNKPNPAGILEFFNSHPPETIRELTVHLPPAQKEIFNGLKQLADVIERMPSAQWQKSIAQEARQSTAAAGAVKRAVPIDTLTSIATRMVKLLAGAGAAGGAAGAGTGAALSLAGAMTGAAAGMGIMGVGATAHLVAPAVLTHNLLYGSAKGLANFLKPVANQLIQEAFRIKRRYQEGQR